MLFNPHKNIKKGNYNILFLYLFIFILFNDIKTNNNDIKNIFIIIHGTWIYSIPSLLFSFLEKELIIKRWSRTKNKIAEQKGLIDISDINNANDYLTKEQSIIKYKSENNKRHPHSKYYKYNWDGFLSEKNRNDAGKILATELLKIKKKFPYAKIHIIGYSHGGNVALNAIKFLPQKNDLIIDELILLATPIGQKTEILANKKNKNQEYFFKKIFCFYSSGDLTQIKDFLFNFPRCNRFLTQRKKNVMIIECKYNYYDAETNTQINYLPNHRDFWIPIKKKIIQNEYFSYSPVLYYIQNIIDELTQYKTNTFIDIPHHKSYYMKLKKNNYRK